LSTSVFTLSNVAVLIEALLAQTELEQEVEKAKRKLAENEKALASVVNRLERLELQEVDEEDDDGENENEEEPQAKQPDELRTFTEEELEEFDAENLKAQIALLEGELVLLAHKLCNNANMLQSNRADTGCQTQPCGTERVQAQREGILRACTRSRAYHTG